MQMSSYSKYSFEYIFFIYLIKYQVILDFLYILAIIKKLNILSLLCSYNTKGQYF